MNYLFAFYSISILSFTYSSNGAKGNIYCCYGKEDFYSENSQRRAEILQFKHDLFGPDYDSPETICKIKRVQEAMAVGNYSQIKYNLIQLIRLVETTTGFFN